MIDFSTSINASRNLLAIYVNGTSVTPKRTLDRDALPLEVREKLPPQEISSNPGLDWIDSKELKAFSSLKDEANRLIGGVSVSFIGAIRCVEATDQVVQFLETKLGEIQAKYRAARDKVVDELPLKIAAHKANYPMWAGVIDDIAPTAGYIRDQIDFDWVWVPIGAAASIIPATVQEVVDNRMKTNIETMVDKLYLDIAESVGQIVKRHEKSHGSFLARNEVGRRILDPLGVRPTAKQDDDRQDLSNPPISSKLRTLAFLHESTAPLADYIDQLVARLDLQSAPIKGNDIILLHGLLTALSDRDRIKALCQDLMASGVSQMVDQAAKAAHGMPQQQSRVPVARVNFLQGLMAGNTPQAAPEPAPESVPAPAVAAPATPIVRRVLVPGLF